MMFMKKLMNNSVLFLKSFAKGILHYEHRLLTASNPRHDDLYIVSYPKSGATWVNFLMANINLIESNDGRNVTFYNVHDIIPDIHHTRDISSDSMVFPGYRVIKSHGYSGYNPFYNKVIYIVRDPRDVMVSYFHFLRGVGKLNGDISRFIRSKDHGISAWCRHVNSWFMDSPANLSFFYIKYEDLKSDPVNTLRIIYSVLGHNIKDTTIEKAVELSSFSNMKRLENEYAYGGREIARNLTFMRKGEHGDGKVQLSHDDMNFINQRVDIWLKHFGYD